MFLTRDRNVLQTLPLFLTFSRKYKNALTLDVYANVCINT